MVVVVGSFSVHKKYLELRLHGVCLHRDERSILRDVTWCIAPGQRWVVLGANGAGKTQLLKILAGTVWPDVSDCPPSEINSKPVLTYFWQGDSFQTVHGVIEEIAYLGPEQQDRYERYSWNHSAIEIVGTGLMRSDIPQRPLRAAENRIALNYLYQLKASLLAERYFLTLSFGERRLVLFARALAARPRLLLLDELFGGLDEINRKKISAWLENSANSLLPWVLTTHRREEIPHSATHILELVDGRVKSAGLISKDRAKTSSARVHTLPNPSLNIRSHQVTAQILVAFKKVNVFIDYKAVLKDIDFEISSGQCLVVHGPNGCGKSSLLRSIYGDYPAALGGFIKRAGIKPGVPISDFKKWCSLVAPHLQSDPPKDTVLDIVVSGLRSSIGLDERPSRMESRHALAALENFGLAERATDPVRTLSYGQVRCVMFARAWVAKPRLLLLDEALAGLDAATRHILRQKIKDFVLQGGAVVFASHHRDEWPDNTSHEMELRHNRIIFCGAVRAMR